MSCDASIEHHVDPIDDASNGLSMLAQGVQSDGTAVQVQGQCSHTFQSQCKIKDKVCKLIIDDGSFTNAISCSIISIYAEAFNVTLYAMDKSKWYVKNYSQGEG
jgi:hypothetical protein